MNNRIIAAVMFLILSLSAIFVGVAGYSNGLESLQSLYVTVDGKVADLDSSILISPEAEASFQLKNAGFGKKTEFDFDVVILANAQSTLTYSVIGLDYKLAEAGDLTSCFEIEQSKSSFTLKGVKSLSSVLSEKHSGRQVVLKGTERYPFSLYIYDKETETQLKYKLGIAPAGVTGVVLNPSEIVFIGSESGSDEDVVAPGTGDSTTPGTGDSTTPGTDGGTTTPEEPTIYTESTIPEGAEIFIQIGPKRFNYVEGQRIIVSKDLGYSDLHISSDVVSDFKITSTLWRSSENSDFTYDKFEFLIHTSGIWTVSFQLLIEGETVYNPFNVITQEIQVLEESTDGEPSDPVEPDPETPLKIKTLTFRVGAGHTHAYYSEAIPGNTYRCSGESPKVPNPFFSWIIEADLTNDTRVTNYDSVNTSGLIVTFSLLVAYPGTEEFVETDYISYYDGFFYIITLTSYLESDPDNVYTVTFNLEIT